MPTYQYACTECGHQFEEFQSFSDAALTDCPVCGGRLRKVYGSVGVVFKGSGFYRTDSRNGDGKVAKSADPAAPKSSPEKSSSGDGGSSKPAPATTSNGSSTPASSSTSSASSTASGSGSTGS
ncbi:FmdB family zinc ribbon protein [Nakamurella deserti]|uniref:FmdB family zinc ribbon protein n=1 Tax=Nakamurella deserti TaxID=2164074 RepID=UPI000DBE85B1|nr:FmdB family zinc ribbon protein [Nakamurella deserti]